MENVKIPFFKRLKKAVIDFESYSDFAVEKINIAIKYFAKLMIIFSILISISFTYKFSTIINNEEQMQIMYNQLADTGIDLKLVDELINYVKSNNNAELYLTFGLSTAVYVFATYFIFGLFDALLVCIVGIIVSRIIRIRLKYKPIYIMSIYALTLSIILNCIYIIANTFTGFTIEYFGLVYNVIAYIYIVTAILMIKTDFIEQQGELIKILNEQEKIRREHEQDNNENPDEKPDENSNDEQDKNPEEKPPEEPLGEANSEIEP